MSMCVSCVVGGSFFVSQGIVPIILETLQAHQEAHSFEPTRLSGMMCKGRVGGLAVGGLGGGEGGGDAPAGVLYRVESVLVS